MHDDFQLLFHYGNEWPEWGSAPRKPLVQFDMAHKGEWLESVMGPDPATGTDMIYHIVRCELCIGIHAWPFPTEEALARYYAERFYEHEKPDMIARYERDAAWWTACMHGPLLDGMAAALHEQGPAPVSILDIGAGPGLLLDEARRRGWDTTAIEPGPLCRARLAQAGHRLAPPLGVDGAQGGVVPGFAMITMWETLEHLPCPEETLLQVYDLLRPGGVLGICVPNDYTPAQYAACARYGLAHWWLSPVQHLNYFTPKTLQLLARRCGFALTSLWTTFPLIEHFILDQGRCYVGNDTLGRECHRERMSIELDDLQAGRWEARMAQYKRNAEQRIGREIVAVFTKEI